jgi:hypothetical protein
VAVAAIFGCASAASDPSATHRSGSLLTAEEIAGAHADITTAYDAVARLRPNWLAAHGASAYATVFLDGQKYADGDLSSLRTIEAYHIARIRYYDMTQAGARFGLQAGEAGAIEVTTKIK